MEGIAVSGGVSSLIQSSFSFSDAISLIIIGILYGVGKDRQCNQGVMEIVLAFIIIKSSLILIRGFLWWIMWMASTIGLIIEFIFNIVWIIGMCIFYIIWLIYFFDSENDWLEKSSVIWVAMLLIIIEAISMFIILPCVLCWTVCAIPSIHKIKNYFEVQNSFKLFCILTWR